MTNLGSDVWSRVLTQLDNPSVGSVAESIADSFDLNISDAYDIVEKAITEGTLTEEDTGGTFSAVRLATDNETSETPKADVHKSEESGNKSTIPGRDGSDPVSTTPLNEDIAELSGEWFHPDGIVKRDIWVAWILDDVGRKRPVAPWQNGHAYPAKWSEGLDEEDRPETDYETARRWVEFDLGDTDISIPEDAQSDGLDLGIILPAERPDKLEDRITLVDWDDVRDPETGAIHPVAVEYIRRFGGYVEVSTSGEGLHQFVTGGLRHRGKFIAPIDDEPFIGDDLPQVEIYDGGRHVAMTGRHVAGTDRDVAEGQEMIDEIVTEYADAEVDAGHRRFDPETGEDAGPTGDAGDGRGSVPEPERGDYIGPSIDDLRETKPDNRSLAYHAAVETFYRGGGNASGYANIQNWRLEGFVAALGELNDLAREEIKRDLGGAYLDETDVDQNCVHRTPERVEYAYERAASDRFAAPSYDTLARYGVLPPEFLDDEDGEEWRDDPRSVSATVDVRRAWEAAGRVTPDDLDDDRLDAAEDGEAFTTPTGDRIDVVRAVAVAEGIVDSPDEPLNEAYPEAYALAREEYGAPLPEYHTTSDAIAEFDAVLEVISEVSFFQLNPERLASEVTGEGDEVSGEAVRALNPVWRESESEASVLVFESGVIWDADTERVLDVVRFAALDTGIIDEPGDPLAGEDFVNAYGAARNILGAPLPRWDPATDGTRELTPQLPPSEELVEARDLGGVNPGKLQLAREEVEELIRENTGEADEPTVVASLPATGKTTGTVKTAGVRPLSYLAPRKELQAQALDKAESRGIDAEVLPVFSEQRIRDEVLAAAVSHVRECGKERLRDLWAILSTAFDDVNDEADADDLDLGDIFAEQDEDGESVDLNRPTCETAEGEHGVAWALVVHVARRLGYTPREIHTQARGLFGAPLPCDHGEGETCEYSDGWDRVTDADNPPDLLVGSYIHAHVESVRTEFTRASNGSVETAPRAVVLDEFVGEAFVDEFDEKAEDFATWLARCLCEGVVDRRDMLETDLAGDAFVTAWLAGEAAEVDDAVGEAIDVLDRSRDLLDAREAAREILEEIDDETLRELELAEPLKSVLREDASESYDVLHEAISAIDRNAPAPGVVRWADDEVREPLETATAAGRATPEPEPGLADDLSVGGNLATLVNEAVEALRETRADARERLDAAVAALRGGPEGCRRLAVWADDGYAHPEAHHILEAVVAETPDRIDTGSWAFDPDATDGTVVDVAETGENTTTILDRNGHGARVHTPPTRTDAAGEDVPLVGLDATGRASLWSVALGEDVSTDDIHDTPSERAQFLNDVLDLRVVQAADRPRPYEGDPSSKDTDGDVALLEAINEDYAGIEAPRDRGEAPTEVGRPAAITTKSVREVLENDDRLDDVVSGWDHYGNVTGKNNLGGHRLAAILGSQHYGDDAVERFAALAGESVDTSRAGGRGRALSYDSDIADEYLALMREDQTAQAILRFARGDSGATVVARTSALREDLPVVGRGQVVETWNDTATKIARAYRRLGRTFTIADVRDVVDVTARQVRRILAEFTDAGYICRVEESPGQATVYERADDPGAGEVDLPARDEAVKAGEGGRALLNQTYTWNVRVVGADTSLDRIQTAVSTHSSRGPPSPSTVEEINRGDPSIPDQT